MLSASRIRSASRASAYYGKDDYYVTGEADSPGLEWGGKGADALGLSGRARPDEFSQVLDGAKTGQAQQEPGLNTNVRTHHPGWDLTFSAPKSISVAILLGGDRRLDRAHDQAVQVAMDYAERTLSFTRVRAGGGRREVLTGNLLYASTVHGVSREGDPQRHTHVIVANATREPSARVWRALDSLQLYRHRLLLGKIYQAELAKAARNLGYHVRRGPTAGTFELDAWSSRELRVFAKRTEAIMKAFALERPTTPAARDAVKMKGRPTKLSLPRGELLARWKAEAREAGLDYEGAIAEAFARGKGEDHTPAVRGRISDRLSKMRALAGRAMAPVDRQADPYRYLPGQADRHPGARKVVSHAIQSAEARSAVFTQHEVVERALDLAGPGITLADVEREVGRLIADRRLINADRNGAPGLTTARALATEASILAALDAGRCTQRPILTVGEVHRKLFAMPAEGVVLNEGQRAAVATILSTADNHVAVQGAAGVGKTTMFRAAQALARSEGWSLSAITPTHRAATAMISEAGVPATTIAAWVVNTAKGLKTNRGTKAIREHWRSRALIVDEASMVSNAQMDTVLTLAERAGITRVILVGDEKQLGSPDAGAPFRLLLNRDIDQARMTEILRQKDPTLREGVQLLAAGKPAAAIRMIEAHVHEVGRGASDTALADAAVSRWVQGRARGIEPRIVVPTNALRGLISDRIRTELRAVGALRHGGEQRQQYLHARRDGPSRFQAGSYSLGDRLVFHAAHRAAGIRPGDEVQVIGLDTRNDILRVVASLGHQSIDLAALRRAGRVSFETYRVRDAEVAEGERLVWERADRKRGMLTGAGFTVVEIGERDWLIRHDDGRLERVSSSDPVLKFTGYGYAETADRAQGQTYRSVVAVLGSRHGDAVSAARQYVMQSRPSEQFTLVTDDRQLLVFRLAKRDGLNLIATEQALSGLPTEPDRELRKVGAERPGADKTL